MSSCVSSVMRRWWIARARATRSGWACSDAARPAAIAQARDAGFMRLLLPAYVTMRAMIRFARLTLSVLAVLLGAVFVAAQTDVTGEWEASYATPLGPQELKIYLTQEGPRISGHTTSEYGES